MILAAIGGSIVVVILIIIIIILFAKKKKDQPELNKRVKTKEKYVNELNDEYNDEETPNS